MLNQDTGNSDIVMQGSLLSEHPDITVERIIAGEVRLTDGKQWWTLELEVLAPIRESSGPADLIRIFGKNSTLNSEEQVMALLSADAGRRTYDNILSEAAFSPYIEEGQQRGLYLSSVQIGGFTPV